MSINFPASLDTSTQFPAIGPTDKENDAGKEHDVIHSHVNAAILEIQNKIGANSSEVSSSHDFKLSHIPCDIYIACSDEVTALAAGASLVTFVAQRDMIISAIHASLTTHQSGGSIFTIDVNKNGSSLLSTKVTIDNTETSSRTAATAAVLSATSIIAGDIFTIDIDQIGNGTAKGLKVYIIGTTAA